MEPWAFAEPETADDFVIVRYTLANTGDSPLNDLYVGLFLDPDINYSLQNMGGTDSDRNLVYMTDSSDVHVGVRLLQDEPQVPPIANLTLIHNPTYVWPNSYILDEDKYGFLSASSPEYVLADAPDPNDYGMLASSGPLSLAPGEEQFVAFAILGSEGDRGPRGSGLANLLQNADVAQEVHENGLTGIPGGPTLPVTTRLLPSTPNPFHRSTVIRFALSQPGDVRLDLYDVAGRRVRQLARGWHQPDQYDLVWDGRDEGGRQVASGVYLLKLSAGQGSESRRLIRIK